MHDTRQFREHAERCEQLAREESLDNSIRKLYHDVAIRWRLLADDIDADAEQKQSHQTERSARPFEAGISARRSETASGSRACDRGFHSHA